MRGDGHPVGRFDYDAADNLMKVSGTPSSFSATTNALNQLATVNGEAWQYDADGNLLNDGTHQYAWDAAGRLIAATDTATGKVTTYRYDGLGRRLEITSQGGGASPADTRYLWCGSTICQTRDGGDAVTADTFDQGEMHGTAALYYIRDQLGSVIGVTDASGKVLGATRYGAYGAVEASRGTQPDFGYAGMLRAPSSALYLTLFREYDPAVGRWLSRDPIGESGGENIYAYVGGNPSSFVDPLGLTQWQGTMTGGGAAVGIGGSFYEFVLDSECKNGKKAHVVVDAVGPTFGPDVKGTLPAGLTSSSVTLNDGLDDVNPDVLNGWFMMYSAGASLFKGYSASMIQLGGNGRGLQKPINSGAFSGPSFGSEKGIELGAGVTAGSSTVMESSFTSCGCGN